MTISGLFEEWKARRRGRRHLPRTGVAAARDITGPTGSAYSAGWEALEHGGEAYLASFDRRLPPSLFVSERDRKRANLVMPLVERCIEDWPEQSGGLNSKSTE